MAKSNDQKNLSKNVQKYEQGYSEEEKRTLSIRLTEESIEKITNRVEKLKANGEMPRKMTVSSYVSWIMESFAKEDINSSGDLC